MQFLYLASQNWATLRDTANIMNWWPFLDALGADFGNVHDSFDQGACVQARSMEVKEYEKRRRKEEEDEEEGGGRG